MIFDIETNGLKLDEISVVWCICAIDRGRRAAPIRSRRDPRGSRAARLRRSARRPQHRVLRSPGPRAALRFPLPSAKVVDTLVLSRLLCNGLSNEPGPARSALARGVGIAARVRERRVTTDFSRFSPAMLDYCLRDCEVVERLLDRLPSHANRARRRSSSSSHYDRLLRRIERHGFTLDTEATLATPGEARATSRAVPGASRRDLPADRDRDRRRAVLHLRGDQRPALRRSVSAMSHQDGARDLAKGAQDPTARRPARRGTAGRQDVERFNASSPASSDPADAVARLGAGARERVRIDQDVRGRALPLGTPRRSIDCSVSRIREAPDRSPSNGSRMLAAESSIRRFLGNQAATGRSSSARSPNIQQIPTDKKRKSGLKVLRPYGRRCRSLFRPQAGIRRSSVATSRGSRSGSSLTASHPYDGGDFARRVASGEDLHQQNAKLLGIPRETAKTVLYGCMYGIGARALAVDLGISREDGTSRYRRVHVRATGIRSRCESHLITEYRRDKRIELDRRSADPGPKGVYAARVRDLRRRGDPDEALGSSRSRGELAETSYRMLAVVHDEIQGECLDADVEQVKHILRQAATDAGEGLGFRVPIDADAKEGRSWSETH